MDFFESAYEGTPPWDIGRPQKEFIRLAEDGEIRSTFGKGWKINYIREAELESKSESVKAWLSSITHL